MEDSGGCQRRRSSLRLLLLRSMQEGDTFKDELNNLKKKILYKLYDTIFMHKRHQSIERITPAALKLAKQAREHRELELKYNTDINFVCEQKTDINMHDPPMTCGKFKNIPYTTIAKQHKKYALWFIRTVKNRPIEVDYMEKALAELE